MAQILVVDDSNTVREEVSGFLEKNHLTVTTAVDGKDGLEKIKQDATLKLIICDINMPNMDGLTMVEKVRNDLNNQVPVIMLTTESNSLMKERGKSAGIKGWIVKPFNGDNAINGIKKLVGA